MEGDLTLEENAETQGSEIGELAKALTLLSEVQKLGSSRGIFGMCLARGATLGQKLAKFA
jgi:hypothetical protein